MNRIEKLFELLEKATSQFHVVSATKEDLLANGFEEGEALLVVDILRRAGIYCDIVSIVGTTPVGSHDIMIYADKLIEESFSDNGEQYM